MAVALARIALQFKLNAAEQVSRFTDSNGMTWKRWWSCRQATLGGCCSRGATVQSCWWAPAWPSSPRSMVRHGLMFLRSPDGGMHCIMDGWRFTKLFVEGMDWNSKVLCGLHAGINAVLFYAPVIFTALGASQQAALLSAVAVSPAGFRLHALPGHQRDQYLCCYNAS